MLLRSVLAVGRPDLSGRGCSGDWAADNTVAHSFYPRNRILSCSLSRPAGKIRHRVPCRCSLGTP